MAAGPKGILILKPIEGLLAPFSFAVVFGWDSAAVIGVAVIVVVGEAEVAGGGADDEASIGAR